MTLNNRRHNGRVLIRPQAARLPGRDVAPVLRLPLPERPYDFRSALRFATLSLAVSLALIAAFAVLLHSTRELAGAFLPGLTWW